MQSRTKKIDVRIQLEFNNDSNDLLNLLTCSIEGIIPVLKNIPNSSSTSYFILNYLGKKIDCYISRKNNTKISNDSYQFNKNLPAIDRLILLKQFVINPIENKMKEMKEEAMEPINFPFNPTNKNKLLGKEIAQNLLNFTWPERLDFISKQYTSSGLFRPNITYEQVIKDIPKLNTFRQENLNKIITHSLLISKNKLKTDNGTTWTKYLVALTYLVDYEKHKETIKINNKFKEKLNDFNILNNYKINESNLPDKKNISNDLSNYFENLIDLFRDEVDQRLCSIHNKNIDTADNFDKLIIEKLTKILAENKSNETDRQEKTYLIFSNFYQNYLYPQAENHAEYKKIPFWIIKYINAIADKLIATHVNQLKQNYQNNNRNQAETEIIKENLLEVDEEKSESEAGYPNFDAMVKAELTNNKVKEDKSESIDSYESDKSAYSPRNSFSFFSDSLLNKKKFNQPISLLEKLQQERDALYLRQFDLKRELASIPNKLEELDKYIFDLKQGKNEIDDLIKQLENPVGYRK